MPKSSYLNNAVLNAVLRNTALTSPTTVYVALFSGNPTSGGTEASGGSYARQSTTFSAASAGATANTSSINFTNMPSMTVSYVAIYDALTSGNLLYYAPAAASKTVNSGDTVAIAIGGIVVTES